MVNDIQQWSIKFFALWTQLHLVFAQILELEEKEEEGMLDFNLVYKYKPLNLGEL